MSRYRNVALFVLLATLWGVSFPAIKAGLPFIPPVLFAAGRYDTGGLFLLAYVAVAGNRLRPRTRDDVVAILAGGAFLVAGNGFVFVGEQYTTSAVAAVIFSLNPILTSAFAWVLLAGERYSAVSILGVFVGLFGVYVVARPEPTDMLRSDLTGPLLVLFAAVSVSLGSVLVKRASTSIPTVSLTAWAMVVGGVILHVASLGAGESPMVVEATPALVVSLLYLGVLASAVAYIVYFVLLDEFGPLEVNTVSYAIPVVAAVVGWLWLGEAVTPVTVLGLAVIFAGFVLLKRREFARELPDRWTGWWA